MVRHISLVFSTTLPRSVKKKETLYRGGGGVSGGGGGVGEGGGGGGVGGGEGGG